MDRHELGRFGEERAARWLRRHGYRIIETNFSCRSGEIDLIARDGLAAACPAPDRRRYEIP